MSTWKFLNPIATFTTPWLTLIGERLLDEQGKALDYWRIETDDSVIVIPVQGETLIIAGPYYRHGIQQETLDFPGGRRSKKTPLNEAALGIIERELGIDKKDVISIDAINTQGWPVNSSFSNQLLYGFAARLDPEALFAPEFNVEKVPLKNVKGMLERLDCLQCRSVLLEWMFQNNMLSG